MKKTLQQARVEALLNGVDLQESRQFPVHFKDGTTIYMQPEKMETSSGVPVVNVENYLKKHHPDRLDEYKVYRAGRENYFKNTLDTLTSKKSKFPFKN